LSEYKIIGIVFIYPAFMISLEWKLWGNIELSNYFPFSVTVYAVGAPNL